MNRIASLYGLGDREFYQTLFRLSLPIIIQNALSSMLYMVDTIMIGLVGEVEIAAVGSANQLNFILMMFIFGICSGASIFIAQYWGQRDVKNIRRIQGIALLSALLIALVFALTGVFAGQFVMRIYSHDPQVIELGSKYLRIASIGYLFQSITLVYLCVLRSCENVVLSMVSSIVAILVNTSLNYVLIFGKFGFPALGVEGAAIATCIATIAGLLVVLLRTYTVKNVTAAKLSELFFTRTLLKEFLKVSLPVFFNEALWGLGTSLMTVLYGIIGTQAVAGTQISGTMDRIAFVVFIGVGNSCAIMIGNRIGEKRYDDARLYAKRFLALGITLGIAVGALIFFASDGFTRLFNVSEEVRLIARGIIRVAGCGFWLFMFNYISIVGILRSGGDTLFSTLVDVGGLWVVTLPLAYVAWLMFHLPVYLVYACQIPGDIAKLIANWPRIKKGDWLNDLNERTARLTAEELPDPHLMDPHY